VLPFLLLMGRTVKRRAPALLAGAGWVLLMHLLDIYWLVMPSLHPQGARPGLLDAAALLAVGGVFAAAVGWILVRRPLVPLRDPRLAESLALENA
jgi:apolipoprotein N-acyltransferase